VPGRVKRWIGCGGSVSADKREEWGSAGKGAASEVTGRAMHHEHARTSGSAVAHDGRDGGKGVVTACAVVGEDGIVVGRARGQRD